MDYFEPFAPSRASISARVSTRFLAISFDSDWRFGSASTRATSSTCSAEAGVDVDHVEISSPWGHDCFLLDLPDYHRVVTEALTLPVGSQVR